MAIERQQAREWPNKAAVADHAVDGLAANCVRGSEYERTGEGYQRFWPRVRHDVARGRRRQRFPHAAPRAGGGTKAIAVLNIKIAPLRMNHTPPPRAWVLIVGVETAKEYRQLAAKYRAFGFNLVPLGGDKTLLRQEKVYDNGRLEILVGRTGRPRRRPTLFGRK